MSPRYVWSCLKKKQCHEITSKFIFHLWSILQSTNLDDITHFNDPKKCLFYVFMEQKLWKFVCLPCSTSTIETHCLWSVFQVRRFHSHFFGPIPSSSSQVSLILTGFVLDFIVQLRLYSPCVSLTLWISFCLCLLWLDCLVSSNREELFRMRFLPEINGSFFF